MKFRSISAVLSILTMIAFASCSALFDDDTESITVAAPRGVSRDAWDMTSPDAYMVTVMRIFDDEMLNYLMKNKQIFMYSWEGESEAYYQDELAEGGEYTLYVHEAISLGEKKVSRNLSPGRYLVFAAAVKKEENAYNYTGIEFYMPCYKYENEKSYNYFDYDVIELSGDAVVNLNVKPQVIDND